jgi:hypothetical protein
MMIRIIGDPPLTPVEGTTSYKLIEIFKNSPTSLEMFLEVFNQFPQKNKYSYEKLEKLLGELRSIYPSVSDNVIIEIKTCIQEVYKGTEEEIADFRGELVELVVVQLGPSHKDLLHEYNLVSNGKFYIDDARLGESEGYSDSNLDSVFHSHSEYEEIEDVCCESYECKASVHTYLYVITGRKPPEIIKPQHYKKLKYLSYLQMYFEPGEYFNISFATFQLNTRKDINTLKKMDMSSLSILGGMELSAAWKVKFSPSDKGA